MYKALAALAEVFLKLVLPKVLAAVQQIYNDNYVDYPADIITI